MKKPVCQQFGPIGGAINAVADFAESIAPISSPTIGWEDSQSGKGRIGKAKVDPGGTSSITRQPFQLINASNEDDGLQIRVVYSTLAGEMPDGFSVGDDPVFVLAVTVTGRIFAKLTIDEDTSEVTAREIVVNNGTGYPSDSGTVVYKELGSFIVAAGAITNLVQARYGPIEAFVQGGWDTPWSVIIG